MQDQIIEGFQLSPQQKRLWLFDQDATAYRAQSAILLEGSLDVERLKRTLRQLVDRHEILRTFFHRPVGLRLPCQVVAESAMPSWEQLDLTDIDDSEHEAKINEIFRNDRCRAPESNGSSLVRLTLLKLSVDRHVLFISLPSLCADSRTLKSLASEICELYAAGLRGDTAVDESLQYSDYSEWENTRIDSDDAGEEKTFWQKYSPDI